MVPVQSTDLVVRLRRRNELVLDVLVRRSGSVVALLVPIVHVRLRLWECSNLWMLVRTRPRLVFQLSV